MPNRAAPTKTFITVFIVNSMLGAVSIFLQNAEYKDCGLGLRNGVTGMWPKPPCYQGMSFPQRGFRYFYVAISFSIQIVAHKCDTSFETVMPKAVASSSKLRRQISFLPFSRSEMKLRSIPTCSAI